MTSLPGSVQLKRTFIVVGGRNGSVPLDTLYKYNPDEDSWSLLPSRLAVPRFELSAFPVSMNFRNCT